MKDMICAICGTVGSALAWALGGWDGFILSMCILMVMDYVTGVLVALVWHKSKKTDSGAYQSRAGLKGLLRKFMMICIVVVACLVDRLLGVDYIRDAVCIAFCVNEIMSILENAGLMGLPMPGVLKKALDVLTDKAEQAGTGGGGK